MMTVSAYAHDGHHELGETVGEWIRWFGVFHLIFLHFPIALIVMTCVSELFYFYKKLPFFEHASQFMLLGAAIFAVPTVLFGFALSYGVSYEEPMKSVLWWHQLIGSAILGLLGIALVLRAQYQQNKRNSLRPYYICLALLFVLVNVTGYLGGLLAFGTDVF